MLSNLLSNPPLVGAIVASLVVVAAACKMFSAAVKHEIGVYPLQTCAGVIVITTLIGGALTIDELAGHGRDPIQLDIVAIMALCATIASVWALASALVRRKPMQWKYSTAVLTMATSANYAGVRLFLEEGSTQRLLGWMFVSGWIAAVVVAIFWLEATVKQRKRCEASA